MDMRARLFPLTLVLVACGTARTPPPAEPGAPAAAATQPPLLLPEGIPDPALAACVSGVLADDARRSANRLRQHEVDQHVAATQADEDAWRAKAAAARAQGSGSAKLLYTDRTKAGTTDWIMREEARSAENMRYWQNVIIDADAVSRAAQQVNESWDAAERFAKLAQDHADLFAVHARILGTSDAEELASLRDERARTVAKLRKAVAPAPDDEFLYVQRIARAMASPSPACQGGK